MISVLRMLILVVFRLACLLVTWVRSIILEGHVLSFRDEVCGLFIRRILT